MIHKLVIVDDAPFIREMVRHLVTQESSLKVVGEASEGEEAIEVVRQTHPDVVLIDIVMPNMNGLDAAQLISREFPEMKFIICSSLDKTMIRKKIKKDYHIYLPKPFSKQSLLGSIRKVLEVTP